MARTGFLPGGSSRRSGFRVREIYTVKHCGCVQRPLRLLSSFGARICGWPGARVLALNVLPLRPAAISTRAGFRGPRMNYRAAGHIYLVEGQRCYVRQANVPRPSSECRAGGCMPDDENLTDKRRLRPVISAAGCVHSPLPEAGRHDGSAADDMPRQTSSAPGDGRQHSIPGVAGFKAYLLGIARKKAVDWWRRHRPNSPEALAPDASGNGPVAIRQAVRATSGRLTNRAVVARWRATRMTSRPRS